MKNRSTVFTLGNRGNVLTSELESQIIVPHSAQKNETKVGVFQFFFSLKLCFEKGVHLYICMFLKLFDLSVLNALNST